MLVKKVYNHSKCFHIKEHVIYPTVIQIINLIHIFNVSKPIYHVHNKFCLYIIFFEFMQAFFTTRRNFISTRPLLLCTIKTASSEIKLSLTSNYPSEMAKMRSDAQNTQQRSWRLLHIQLKLDKTNLNLKLLFAKLFNLF